MIADDSTAALRARIAQFCERFGLDNAPKVPVRRGSAIVTDELLDWAIQHGASLDWIFAGNAKPLAAAYAKTAIAEKSAAKALADLDAVEKEIIAEVLRSSQSGDLDFVVALEAAKQAIAAHRNAKEIA